MEFRKQAQRNKLAALVHQINLITSKVVELDPQNPEHYAIVNVNRDSNTSPINWTYADVVMGRIRFHQGRSPVGNVWGITKAQDQSIEGARSEISLKQESKGEAKMNSEFKNVKEMASNIVDKRQTKSEVGNQPISTLKKNFEVETSVKVVNHPFETYSDNPELHNVSGVDEEGKTYADILKGMREASGGFFTTQLMQNPEISKTNIERTHNFIENEKSMNISKRPPRKPKQVSQHFISKQKVKLNESQNIEQDHADISSRPSQDNKKKIKREHNKRRYVESVDTGEGGFKKSQENHSETSSTSGEEVQEKREKPKKRHDKKKTEKSNGDQNSNESEIVEANIDRNIETKRIILITHEAVNKVPIQQIHLSLPQTYAVKVDKPKEQNIQAVSVENVATSVEKIKLLPEAIDEDFQKSEADWESVSTATLDTVIERCLDFPVEKEVILKQEAMSEKVETDKHLENIVEYTDTSEDEITLQGRLEISFIVEEEKAKIEHDISTSIASVTSKKSKTHENEENSNYDETIAESIKSLETDYTDNALKIETDHEKTPTRENVDNVSEMIQFSHDVSYQQTFKLEPIETSKIHEEVIEDVEIAAETLEDKNVAKVKIQVEKREQQSDSLKGEIVQQPLLEQSSAEEARDRVRSITSSIIKKIEDAQARVLELPEESFSENEEKISVEDASERVRQITNKIIMKIEDTQSQVEKLSPEEIQVQLEDITKEVESAIAMQPLEKSPFDEGKPKVQEILQEMMKKIVLHPEVKDDRTISIDNDWDVITEETSEELKAELINQVILESDKNISLELTNNEIILDQVTNPLIFEPEYKIIGKETSLITQINESIVTHKSNIIIPIGTGTQIQAPALAPLTKVEDDEFLKHLWHDLPHYNYQELNDAEKYATLCKIFLPESESLKVMVEENVATAATENICNSLIYEIPRYDLLQLKHVETQYHIHNVPIISITDTSDIMIKENTTDQIESHNETREGFEVTAPEQDHVEIIEEKEINSLGQVVTKTVIITTTFSNQLIEHGQEIAEENTNRIIEEISTQAYNENIPIKRESQKNDENIKEFLVQEINPYDVLNLNRAEALYYNGQNQNVTEVTFVSEKSEDASSTVTAGNYIENINNVTVPEHILFESDSNSDLSSNLYHDNVYWRMPQALANEISTQSYPQEEPCVEIEHEVTKTPAQLISTTQNNREHVLEVGLLKPDTQMETEIEVRFEKVQEDVFVHPVEQHQEKESEEEKEKPYKKKRDKQRKTKSIETEAVPAQDPMNVFQRLDSRDISDPQFDKSFADVLGHETVAPTSNNNMTSITETFITMESKTIDQPENQEIIQQPSQVIDDQIIDETFIPVTEIEPLISESEAVTEVEDRFEIVQEEVFVHPVEQPQEKKSEEKKEKPLKKKRDKQRKTKSIETEDVPAQDPMNVFQRLDSRDISDPQFDKSFADVLGHETVAPTSNINITSVTETFITMESKTIDQPENQEIIQQPSQVIDDQIIDETFIPVTEIEPLISESEAVTEVEDRFEIVQEEIFVHPVEQPQEKESEEKKEKPFKKKRDKQRKTKSIETEDVPAQDPMNVFQRLDSRDISDPQFDKSFTDVLGQETVAPTSNNNITYITETFITMESKTIDQPENQEIIQQPSQVIDDQIIDETFIPVTEIEPLISESEAVTEVEDRFEIVQEEVFVHPVEQPQEKKSEEKKEKPLKKKRDKQRKTKSIETEDVPAQDPMNVFQRLDSRDISDPQFDKSFADVLGHETVAPTSNINITSVTETFITMESKTIDQPENQEIIQQPSQVIDDQIIDETFIPVTEIEPLISESEAVTEVEDRFEIVQEEVFVHPVEQPQEKKSEEKKEKPLKKKRDKQRKTKSIETEDVPAQDPMNVFQRLDSRDISDPQFDKSFADVLGHETVAPTSNINITSVTETFITMESKTIDQPENQEIIQQPSQVIDDQIVDETFIPVTEIKPLISESEAVTEVEDRFEIVQEEVFVHLVEQPQEKKSEEKKEKPLKKKRDKQRKTKSIETEDVPAQDPMNVFQRLDSRDISDPQFDKSFADVLGHETVAPTSNINITSVTETFITMESKTIDQPENQEIIQQPSQVIDDQIIDETFIPVTEIKPLISESEAVTEVEHRFEIVQEEVFVHPVEQPQEKKSEEKKEKPFKKKRDKQRKTKSIETEDVPAQDPMNVFQRLDSRDISDPQFDKSFADVLGHETVAPTSNINITSVTETFITMESKTIDQPENQEIIQQPSQVIDDQIVDETFIPVTEIKPLISESEAVTEVEDRFEIVQEEVFVHPVEQPQEKKSEEKKEKPFKKKRDKQRKTKSIETEDVPAKDPMNVFQRLDSRDISDPQFDKSFADALGQETVALTSNINTTSVTETFIAMESRIIDQPENQKSLESRDVNAPQYENSFVGVHGDEISSAHSFEYETNNGSVVVSPKSDFLITSMSDETFAEPQIWETIEHSLNPQLFEASELPTFTSEKISAEAIIPPKLIPLNNYEIEIALENQSEQDAIATIMTEMDRNQSSTKVVEKPKKRKSKKENSEKHKSVKENKQGTLEKTDSSSKSLMSVFTKTDGHQQVTGVWGNDKTYAEVVIGLDGKPVKRYNLPKEGFASLEISPRQFSVPIQKQVERLPSPPEFQFLQHDYVYEEFPDPKIPHFEEYVIKEMTQPEVQEQPFSQPEIKTLAEPIQQRLPSPEKPLQFSWASMVKENLAPKIPQQQPLLQSISRSNIKKNTSKVFEKTEPNTTKAQVKVTNEVAIEGTHSTSLYPTKKRTSKKSRKAIDDINQFLVAETKVHVTSRDAPIKLIESVQRENVTEQKNEILSEDNQDDIKTNDLQKKKRKRNKRTRKLSQNQSEKEGDKLKFVEALLPRVEITTQGYPSDESNKSSENVPETLCIDFNTVSSIFTVMQETKFDPNDSINSMMSSQNVGSKFEIDVVKNDQQHEVEKEKVSSCKFIVSKELENKLITAFFDPIKSISEETKFEKSHEEKLVILESGSCNVLESNFSFKEDISKLTHETVHNTLSDLEISLKSTNSFSNLKECQFENYGIEKVNMENYDVNVHFKPKFDFKPSYQENLSEATTQPNYSKETATENKNRNQDNSYISNEPMHEKQDDQNLNTQNKKDNFKTIMETFLTMESVTIDLPSQEDVQLPNKITTEAEDITETVVPDVGDIENFISELVETSSEIVQEDVFVYPVEQPQEKKSEEKKEKPFKKKRDKQRKTKSIETEDVPAQDPMNVFQRLDSRDISDPQFDKSFTDVLGQETVAPTSNNNITYITETFITMESKTIDQPENQEIIQQPSQVIDDQIIDETFIPVTEIEPLISESEAITEVEDPFEIVQEEDFVHLIEKPKEKESEEKKEKPYKKKRDKQRKTKSIETEDVPAQDPMNVFQRLDSRDISDPKFDKSFADVLGQETVAPTSNINITSVTETFITMESRTIDQPENQEIIQQPSQVIDDQIIDETFLPVTEIEPLISESEAITEVEDPFEIVQEEVFVHPVEQTQEKESEEKKEKPFKKKRDKQRKTKSIETEDVPAQDPMNVFQRLDSRDISDPKFDKSFADVLGQETVAPTSNINITSVTETFITMESKTIDQPENQEIIQQPSQVIDDQIIDETFIPVTEIEPLISESEAITEVEDPFEIVQEEDFVHPIEQTQEKESEEKKEKPFKKKRDKQRKTKSIETEDVPAQDPMNVFQRLDSRDISDPQFDKSFADVLIHETGLRSSGGSKSPTNVKTITETSVKVGSNTIEMPDLQVVNNKELFVQETIVPGIEELEKLVYELVETPQLVNDKENQEVVKTFIEVAIDNPINQKIVVPEIEELEQLVTELVDNTNSEHVYEQQEDSKTSILSIVKDHIDLIEKPLEAVQSSEIADENKMSQEECFAGSLSENGSIHKPIENAECSLSSIVKIVSNSADKVLDDANITLSTSPEQVYCINHGNNYIEPILQEIFKTIKNEIVAEPIRKEKPTEPIINVVKEYVDGLTKELLLPIEDISSGEETFVKNAPRKSLQTVDIDLSAENSNIAPHDTKIFALESLPVVTPPQISSPPETGHDIQDNDVHSTLNVKVKYLLSFLFVVCCFLSF